MRRLPFVCATAAAALLLTTTTAVADDPPGDGDVGIVTGTFAPEGTQMLIGAVGVERVDDPSAPVPFSTMGAWDYSIRLAPGQYRLWYAPPPSGTDTSWQYYPGVHTRSEAAIVTVRAGETVSGIDFDLQDTAGTIAGAVSYEPNTRPLSSRPFMVPYYLDGDAWLPVPGPNQRGLLDDDSYVINGLPAGTYRLRFEPREAVSNNMAGFLGGTDDAETGTPVEVRPLETTTADMTPRRSGALTGRVVTSGGQPVLAARVIPMVLYDGTWHRGKEAYTNGRGRYTVSYLGGDTVLQFLPPHPYDEVFSGDALRDASQVDAESEPPQDATAIRVVAGATKDVGEQVVQRKGLLEGTVVDRDQGRPVAGVTVHALPVLGVRRDPVTFVPSTISYGPSLSATTDKAGHFAFGRIPRGPYRLRLDDPWNDVFLTEHEGEALDTELFPSVRSIAFVESGVTTVADAHVTGYMPTLSDTTPVVGQKLSAVPPSHADGSPPAGSTWMWRRDGAVIDGATASTYRPVPADRGTRLTAQVVLPTDDKPLVHTSPPSAKVAVGRPALTVTGGSPSAGRVTLTVRGTAPDVPTSLLDGEVEVVHLDTRRRTTASMVDGALTVTLTGQPKGTQTYSARFLAQPDRFAASPLAQRAVTVR